MSAPTAILSSVVINFGCVILWGALIMAEAAARVWLTHRQGCNLLNIAVAVVGSNGVGKLDLVGVGHE